MTRGDQAPGQTRATAPRSSSTRSIDLTVPPASSPGPGKVAAVGRLVVVVPLREGAHGDALALLREGPPLELERDGLDRYQAFLSRHEAILVLEGPGVGGIAAPRWGDLSTWRDGARWQRCARSPPRLAESIHSWERAGDLEGIFFGPQPGPGDSEGGDAVGT